MSSRTYLSIGDVLTLLREEFPDVTISKIRFLESQGLVNPERSPSGYRKFFDHDVERLRWVLRQQREHFLPLKVIRDRLADGDLGDDVGAERPNGKAAQPAHAVAVAGVASGHAHEQPTKADEEAMARILADASRRAARLPERSRTRPGCRWSPRPKRRGRVPGRSPPRHVTRDRRAAPTASERRADAPRRWVIARRTVEPHGALRHVGRAGNGTAPTERRRARQPEAAVTPPGVPPPSEAAARKGDAKSGETAQPGAPSPAAPW